MTIEYLSRGQPDAKRGEDDGESRAPDMNFGVYKYDRFDIFGKSSVASDDVGVMTNRDEGFPETLLVHIGLDVPFHEAAR